MATIGYTTVGSYKSDICIHTGGFDGVSQSNRWGNKISPTENGTVTSISIYLSSVDGIGDSDVKVFINKIDSTFSHTQIAVATLSNGSISVPGWNTIDISATLSNTDSYILNAIGSISSGVPDRIQIHRNLSGSGLGAPNEISVSYASPEDPWTPEVTGGSGAMSIYATYTPNPTPTTTLTTPANATTLTTDTPALTFKATDPESDAVTYQVQVSTDASFASTHTNAVSTVATGWSGTDPYTSGVDVTYTLQTGLTLGGITYYWRARAKDPSGSNTFGAWSANRTMITEALAPSVTSGTATSIAQTTATAGGNVTSANGATITERGIAYGTGLNPTTAGSKVTVAGTTGAFTGNITGLTSNTGYHFRAYAINAKGTTYGSDVAFTTLPIAPTTATGTAGSIDLSSATVTGSTVTNPDTQTITERGVVYAITTTPTTANSKVTSTGSPFNASLTGLTNDTTYYARSYAIWSGGTVYGSQVSFKTWGTPITTLDTPVSDGSSSTTAVQLKFTGNDPDTDTITYQLQLNPTNVFTTPQVDVLSSANTGFSNLSNAKTDPFYNGNQIQYTTADLTRGSDYYWRVRGKDASGSNTWGAWTTAIKFSVTALPPTLTTNGSHDISFDTAQVDATIISDNGSTISARGVCWGTSTNPTLANSSAIGTGSPYTVTLTVLTGATTYYARAYATNAGGTAYGNNINFMTLETPAAPTVVTGSAANIYDIIANFNGNNVTSAGTFTVTERGIVFNTTGTPTTTDRKVTAVTSGLGTYDLGMSGLLPSTTYYVRAYAINSFGTGYGSDVSFTTAAEYASAVGDGYWGWSPGQSQATVSRTQATVANASVNLDLLDLSLTDGLDYTLYFGSVDFDNGSPSVTLERLNGATLITDTITAGTPFTFTYNAAYIHWNIRLFVTGATTASANITTVFNDMYLAQETTFSGYVPFKRVGMTELKLVNNQILDNIRDDTISSIFDQVKGISYYPFNTDTEGLGYFEIGDRLTITDDNAESKSVVVWNSSLTIDGGIKEKLYANIEPLSDTDYTKAGNSRLRGNVRRTQLQVDKQAGEISALVSDMYNLDGVVNTKYTELLQDNESIKATVQGAGGVNLLKNSVMYAFDDTGLPNNWTMTGAGTLSIHASPESLSAGAVSGNQFTLINKTATQTVTVRKDVEFVAEDDKSYYTFSARVKKNTVGVASITLTNRNETLTIALPDQTSYYWDIVSIEAILPKDDHYDIDITSDTSAGLQVTDVIIAPGKSRHEWTQANGEVMNSSVAITSDGMTIRSSAFQNNYTKIDALGFEVHKKDAGGNRIFGFNDDETSVSKLKAEKQIGMPPMRIVPVNYSTYTGWAFTESKEI